MKKTVFLVLMLAIPLTVTAAERKALPEDVAQFIEKRDLCDHFRGEEPYDEERRAFLLQNMIELCTGTDRRLTELRRKYARDAAVIERLSTYEDDIEPNG